MSVKNSEKPSREKRFMTAQEKRLRQMMLEHQVSQVEIAEHEEISEPAVITRLKSLTPSSMAQFEGLIIKLSKQRKSRKVAS